MIHFPQIVTRLLNVPLAVHPGKAAAIMAAFGPRLIGCESVTIEGAEPINHIAGGASAWLYEAMGRLGDPFGQRLEENGVDPLFRVGPVAVIPVEGSLIHKGKWLGSSSGETSYEAIQTRVLQAMADRTVLGVVFEMDTFGGEVAGAFDTAAMIRRLSADKPTLAILTDYALSAGYLLASAARQIIMPETGRAGSVGVITMHVDYSKAVEKLGIKVTILTAGARKGDGNPYEALPEDVANAIRADLETTRQAFAAAVEEGRGDRMSVAAALATEADDFSGAESMELGLVDGVGNPSEAFDAFVTEIKAARRSPFAAGAYHMTASAVAAAARAAAPLLAGDPQGPTQAEHEAQIESTRQQADAAGFARGQAQGQKEGATAATTRVAAILDHENAKGREPLARHLAFRTALSAEDAIATMAATPAVVAAAPPPSAANDPAAGLLAEMAQLQQPRVGMDGPQAANPGGPELTGYERGRAEAKRLLGKT